MCPTLLVACHEKGGAHLAPQETSLERGSCSPRRFAKGCNRPGYAIPGYFASYLAKLSCYVYGPFGRCTDGVRLLTWAHRASPFRCLRIFMGVSHETCSFLLRGFGVRGGSLDF